MTHGDEAPAATDRWGWRYHHTGIPTDKPRAGERYLAQFKMYVSGFPESPYGIEWMRFDADSPISELVRTIHTSPSRWMTSRKHSKARRCCRL